MDRKSWKYRKRSGAIKKKVLKEYLAITNQTINEERSNKQDKQIAVEEPEFSQALASTSYVEGSVSLESVDLQYTNSSLRNQSDSESSSSSGIEFTPSSEFMKNLTFREEIKEWAIKKNISQEAIKNLAVILNKRFPDILPNDPRTILRTPREINLKLFEKGEYWHNGLIRQLEIILDNCIDVLNCISLNINIDGLPIFKSSKIEFWPILCQVFELSAPPFIVGIYCGVGKPNLNSFMEDFIKEMRKVLVEGVRNVKIKIRCIICDSPARAYIKDTALLTFFNFHDVRIIRDNFCFYHINAPGQENGALSLPKNYVYPTMDQLANQINFVLGHFGIQEFIGFGIGAGANILARFALTYPQKVNALILVNCTSTQSGWLEWGSQKMNVRALRSRGMTQKLVDNFLWELLGSDNSNRFPDSAVKYRSFLSQSLNPHNLAMFIESYARRSDLGISREAISLNVPVLNMTGAQSHRVDDTVTLNGRLYPNTTSWMKISDCSLIFEEQPAKLAEAFRLFLQGEGFVPPLSPTKIVAYHEVLKNEYPKANPVARRRPCRHTIIRITENPISEAVAC